MSGMSYVDNYLPVWLVGVRNIKRRDSAWGRAWHPTSREWFRSRRECWNYIRSEIPTVNFEVYEYKPIKYQPEKQ